VGIFLLSNAGKQAMESHKEDLEIYLADVVFWQEVNPDLTIMELCVAFNKSTHQKCWLALE